MCCIYEEAVETVSRRKLSLVSQAVWVNVFCLLGISNSRIPGRKTKQCALCLVRVETLKSMCKSPVSCTLATSATESCLLGCQELFSAEGSWLTQHSPATWQECSRRSELKGGCRRFDHWFILSCHTQDFFHVCLHGDEFDHHPRAAQAGVEITPRQIYTLLCTTGNRDTELLTHWTAQSRFPLRHKKYIFSSGRQSKLLINDKNVSFFAKQLSNTS